MPLPDPSFDTLPLPPPLLSNVGGNVRFPILETTAQT
jgi:hypothetical protein